MGFALLETEAFDEDVVEGSSTMRFHAADVEVTVGPLPSGRISGALFQPRSLLVLTGEGARAERLKEAVRRQFLRVMG